MVLAATWRDILQMVLAAMQCGPYYISATFHSSSVHNSQMLCCLIIFSTCMVKRKTKLYLYQMLKQKTFPISQWRKKSCFEEINNGPIGCYVEWRQPTLATSTRVLALSFNFRWSILTFLKLKHINA